MSQNEETNCGAIQTQLSLLLYGELSFDEEERVESHLSRCAACRSALESERAIHTAIDQVETLPSPVLLRECRDELRMRLSEEKPMPGPGSASWWDRIVDALALKPSAGMLRPVGALALVTMGFFGARLTPLLNSANHDGIQAMGVAEPQASRVRYVEPASDGRVQIVLDETRQRVVLGKLDDQQIRTMLLDAAKDPQDPGLRAESVEILNARAQSADVRDVLIYALGHDQNAGVRMKALQGLKPLVHDPEVRGAFSQVLLSDINPGLRTQAIDLLTEARDANMDRQMMMTLQELMERGEQQDYVRERCRQVLEAMKASSETY